MSSHQAGKVTSARIALRGIRFSPSEATGQNLLARLRAWLRVVAIALAFGGVPGGTFAAFGVAPSEGWGVAACPSGAFCAYGAVASDGAVYGWGAWADTCQSKTGSLFWGSPVVSAMVMPAPDGRCSGSAPPNYPSFYFDWSIFKTRTYICPANSKFAGVGACECKTGFKERPFPNAGTCAPEKEGNPAQAPQMCSAPPHTPHPIFPLTGAKKVFVSTGIALGGIELSLTYDTTKVPSTSSAVQSALQEPSAFGAQWKSNFHRKLVVLPGGTRAMLSRGDGKVLYFGDTTSSLKISGPLSHRLAATADGYVFSDTETGTLESFDSAGRLKSVSTTQGKLLTFTYDGQDNLVKVQSGDGRTLSFSYADGLITRITGPDWSTIAAAYDVNRNLTSLTWQDGKAYGFLYEDPNLPWALTGRVDENNSRYATFAYDAEGHAISSELAGGVEKYTVTYSTPARLVPVEYFDAAQDAWIRTFAWEPPGPTTVTGPNQQASTLNAQVAGGMPSLAGQTQPAGSGCAASANAQEYDGNGNITLRDDFKGARTCYVYDALNRETSRVEGLVASTDSCGGTPPAYARKILTEWHADWHLPTKVTEPLREMTTIYLGQAGAPANCAPGVALRADGKPLPLVCKRTTRSLVAGEAGLPAQVEAFTYDASGRLLTAADPVGNVTTYAYYSDAVFSGNAYDSDMEKVVLLLHGDGTGGAVDSSGSAKVMTTKGTAQINGTHKFGDGSMLFPLTGSAGNAFLTPNSTEFQWGTGDFTLEGWIRPTGFARPEGVVVGVISSGTGSLWALSTDASGYLKYQRNTSNVITSSAPLALNTWQHVAVARSGTTTRMFIDGALVGSVTDSFDYGGAPSYALSVGSDSAAGVGAQYVGNIDELRITKGKARYTASFTPPTPEFFKVGPTAIETGHATGDLQSITNAAGHVTQLAQYDPAGRVRQMTDPKGVITDITYTPRGWVGTVTTTPPGGAARTTTYTYDFAGQLTGAALPDGTTLSYSYDAAHRLKNITDARGNSVTYNLDNASNRTGEEVRDSSGVLQRSISRSFDALNRVQQVTGAAR
jgi:YD repeat-containing protein